MMRRDPAGTPIVTVSFWGVYGSGKTEAARWLREDWGKFSSDGYFYVGGAIIRLLVLAGAPRHSAQRRTISRSADAVVFFWKGSDPANAKLVEELVNAFSGRVLGGDGGATPEVPVVACIDVEHREGEGDGASDCRKFFEARGIPVEVYEVATSTGINLPRAFLSAARKVAENFHRKLEAYSKESRAKLKVELEETRAELLELEGQERWDEAIPLAEKVVSLLKKLAGFEDVVDLSEFIVSLSAAFREWDETGKKKKLKVEKK
ncbi:MAG: hypothetical protein ACTSU5_17740 [Promethearchaeota archaeon]